MHVSIWEQVEGILPGVDPIEFFVGSSMKPSTDTTSAAMIFLMSRRDRQRMWCATAQCDVCAAAANVRDPVIRFDLLFSRRQHRCSSPRSWPIRRVGARRIRQLLVERLTIPKTAPEKLWPRRDRR